MTVSSGDIAVVNGFVIVEFGTVRAVMAARTTIDACAKSFFWDLKGVRHGSIV